MKLSRGGLALGVGAVIAGLLVLLKKAEAVPSEKIELDSGLSLQILDAATGQPVPQHSPAVLVAGGLYQVRVTATNQSIQGGQPAAASFILAVDGVAGPVAFTFGTLTYAEWTWSAGPGETRSWDVLFGVPIGAGGLSGQVTVYVSTPDRARLLKQATEAVTVQVAPIEYVVGLTIGVV